MKAKLLEIASSIGTSQQLISAYEYVNGGGELTPKLHVSKDIRDLELETEERRGRVLLLLIPGASPLTTFTLATAFQLRGFEPIILYNDGILPIKPSLRYYSSSKKAMETQRYKLSVFEQKFNISPVSVREILGQDYSCPITKGVEKIGTFEYKNIDISNYAIGSTRKYLQRYSLDENDQRTLKAYQGFLEGAAILADVTQRIIEETDITAALLVEEAYIHGGVPAEVCFNRNINTYIRGGGYRYGKVSFGRASNRTPRTNFASKEIVSEAVDTELSDFQKNRINTLMEKRKAGNAVKTHYTTNNTVSIDVGENNIVGIFSHLLWDAAIAPQQAIYEDIFEWLNDTIEVGRVIKDTHFVIKAHPAEVSKGTDQSVCDWIASEYGTLPENFTVLPPDTDVNTYALIQDLDAGIVYASTVGLEMVFTGVPVVVGGYPPYHGFGITHDPSTQERFKEKIARVNSLKCDENMSARARRFAYMLFILKEFDYPYSAIEYGQHTYVSEEILLSNDNINIILDKVLNGEEVIKHNANILSGDS